MTEPSANPFERYGIDPASTPEVITERFRELVADASEAEREALRSAWDALTRNPEERVRAAFFAHPETRPALGSPPPRKRTPFAAPEPMSLARLLVFPSASELVSEGGRAPVELPLDATDPALAEEP
ncbi:MAG: hypothetical protein JNM74_03345 [Myxococcales bacterium]|nr:hypothetical protein [Myxococcales bacterium]